MSATYTDRRLGIITQQVCTRDANCRPLDVQLAGTPSRRFRRSFFCGTRVFRTFSADWGGRGRRSPCSRNRPVGCSAARALTEPSRCELRRTEPTIGTVTNVRDVDPGTEYGSVRRVRPSNGGAGRVGLTTKRLSKHPRATTTTTRQVERAGCPGPCVTRTHVYIYIYKCVYTHARARAPVRNNSNRT